MLTSLGYRGRHLLTYRKRKTAQGNLHPKRDRQTLSCFTEDTGVLKAWEDHESAPLHDPEEAGIF